jgi:hypothetical protein
MKQCPVCDGRAGEPPRFDDVELRARAAPAADPEERVLNQIARVSVLAALTWLFEHRG